ncbi:MAG TPA: hypothetical protein VHE54_07015 [Puia sp.]|nr:hypothetical protein [Puia sp.]
MKQQPRTIEKQARTSLLLLLTAGFLLSLLYCPPVDIFFDDKEIFRYIGRVIARGGVPYRDVFDHKPPLIYFFNVAGPWGLWVIDTALTLVATLVFFRLCRRHRLAFPWLLPLLFDLLLRNYLVCMGIGMTRAYTAIFLLLFFCLLFGISARRYFWMGLLAAATLLMQQDQLLPLLPMIVYACAKVFTRRPGRSISMAALGFAALSLPVLLYFGFHHALADLWRDAFRFNFDWYTERVSTAEQFRAIHAALEGTGTLMPLVIALTLGITALFLRHANKPLVIAALLTVGLSFIANLLSGHAFNYYLLPLAASLPMLVFAVFDSIGEPFLGDRKSRLLFGFLLCCLPLYNAVQHATHLSTHTDDVVAAMPEYRWLRDQPLTDGQLYIFNNSNWAYAYNRRDILSPSPWIYHYFWGWYPRWDAGHAQLKSIENELAAHHTRFVVDFSGDLPFRDPTALADWKAFLRASYRPVAVPGATAQLLWELTPPPTAVRPAAGPPVK